MTSEDTKSTKSTDDNKAAETDDAALETETADSQLSEGQMDDVVGGSRRESSRNRPRR